jgi:hypothetical protein
MKPGELTPERLDWLEAQARRGGDDCLTWMYYNDDILALITAARERDILDKNLSRVQRHLQYAVLQRESEATP